MTRPSPPGGSSTRVGAARPDQEAPNSPTASSLGCLAGHSCSEVSEPGWPGGSEGAGGSVEGEPGENQGHRP
eukprot:4169475-Alexandrium_andersonii.AAC.1